MKYSAIKIIEWPVKSTNLNNVEDIQKILYNDVYDGCQFKNIKDLKTKITNTIYQFNSMKREDLKALYVTTRQRLYTVLLKNGNICH